MRPRAFITGIAGQDGSYLAELLLARGYDVHGTVRQEVSRDQLLLADYMRPLVERLTLHGVDLANPAQLAAAFAEVEPNECYHLGGPSTVDSNISGSAAIFATILGSTRALLDQVRLKPRCRFFFAGTSEVFGVAVTSPQTEFSEARPRSIYGLAKLAAWDLIVQYRRRYDVFACTGILYNHESIRRPASFLPRKVTLSLARIAAGRQSQLVLGNMDAQRDWGYAPDFVDAMWRVLQAEQPNDYVISTGRLHSVADLVDVACRVLSLDRGQCVMTDPNLYRPAEMVPLCGNSSRIQTSTGWRPSRSFESMIEEMVRLDFQRESQSQLGADIACS